MPYLREKAINFCRTKNANNKDYNHLHYLIEFYGKNKKQLIEKKNLFRMKKMRSNMSFFEKLVYE
jgi:hypothetical protein